MGDEYPMVIRIVGVILCVGLVGLLAAWPVVQEWLKNKLKHLFAQKTVIVEPDTIGTSPVEKTGTTGIL